MKRYGFIHSVRVGLSGWNFLGNGQSDDHGTNGHRLRIADGDLCAALPSRLEEVIRPGEVSFRKEYQAVIRIQIPDSPGTFTGIDFRVPSADGPIVKCQAWDLAWA